MAPAGFSRARATMAFESETTSSSSVTSTGTVLLAVRRLASRRPSLRVEELGQGRESVRLDDLGVVAGLAQRVGRRCRTGARPGAAFFEKVPQT